VEQLMAGKKELDQQLAAKVEELHQAAKASVSESSEQQQHVATKSNLESQLSAVTAAKQQLQLELSVLKVSKCTYHTLPALQIWV
jgi:hypothetical protein